MIPRLTKLRDHPGGQVLVGRDRVRRWAEREARYEAVYAAMDPG